MTSTPKELSKEGSSRFLNIYFNENNIEIRTNQEDDITNAIATGFAKLIAQYWKGVASETELEDSRIVLVGILERKKQRLLKRIFAKYMVSPITPE